MKRRVVLQWREVGSDDEAVVEREERRKAKRGGQRENKRAGQGREEN